eukprot:TRINITY_DN7811_c0_g1_i3.p1 TRINITY_DN7811_c0_g1~~TRINITY_DN7811_c0_g1_i3.p1  ORF type:complete len:157 (-),score=26.73 TRINITY_DN7811_c0_g1_i3:89-559(-)
MLLKLLSVLVIASIALAQGSCAVDPDRSLVISLLASGKLDEYITQANIMCLLSFGKKESCVTDYIASKSGLSSGCSLCWAKTSLCAQANPECNNECVSSTGKSAACRLCSAQLCQHLTCSCTGLTCQEAGGYCPCTTTPQGCPCGSAPYEVCCAAP